jgi:hypothetical protein
MREFVMSHDYDGESWMVGFAALSAGDAEKRIEAMKQPLSLLGPAMDFEGDGRPEGQFAADPPDLTTTVLWTRSWLIF